MAGSFIGADCYSIAQHGLYFIWEGDLAGSFGCDVRHLR